jgi:hypothetical protein
LTTISAGKSCPQIATNLIRKIVTAIGDKLDPEAVAETGKPEMVDNFFAGNCDNLHPENGGRKLRQT